MSLCAPPTIHSVTVKTIYFDLVKKNVKKMCARYFDLDLTVCVYLTRVFLNKPSL